MDKHSYVPTRRLNYRLSPVELGGSFWLLGVGLPLAIAALVIMLPGETAWQALEETVAEIPTAIWMILPLAVIGSLALLAFYRRQAQEAWLELDDTGIRCRPPGHHGRRFWTRHEWRLRWDEIHSATLYRPASSANEPQHWVNTTLALDTTTGSYRLGPLHWECATDPMDRPGLLAGRKLGKRFDALLRQHPLVSALEHKQVDLQHEASSWRAGRKLSRQNHRQQAEAEAAGHIDLLAYPSARIVLGVMLLAAVLALFHFMLLPPLRALWPMPVTTALLAGTLAGIGAWQLTRRMPGRERSALSVMLAVVVALCWHPLGTRTDVLLNGEPEPVTYTVAERGLFNPIDSRYPTLNLTDLNIDEFFDSLEPGSDFEFILVRTGNERYALSLAELYEHTRAFYRE